MVSYSTRRVQNQSLKMSPALVIFLMVVIMGLCALYDNNQVLHHGLAYFARRSWPVPTTTPVSVQLALPKREDMYKTRVAICALSKSKPTWQYVHDSSPKVSLYVSSSQGSQSSE